MDKRSIFGRGLAILLSVTLMAACFPLSIFAEDTTQDPDFSGTNLMNLESVQPSGYTTTTNPYGYGIGEPFLMVEQNELMYLNVWDNKVRQASYFSMGTESALNTFAKNKSGSNGTFSNPNYKLMQAVSFDPTGSGRRDHVAFVGVSGQNKKGYMWVIDTTKGTGSDCSPQVEIGDFGYMFDGNDFEVPTYSNRSFFNIVAGDFDGDGKESIVVYTPKQTPRNQASGCQIQEWDYDGSNKALSKRGEGNSLLMGYYNDHPWYDVEDSEGNQRRKLGVSMAVGDFNGDCVDDLAVLSYCHRLPKDEAKIDYYRPVVKIVYGTKGDTGSSIVTKSAAQSEEFYTSKGHSGGRDRYEFPVGASLTCGDFDGDGDVDLFLAGMLGQLGTWKKNNQQVNETIDMKAGYLYIGKLSNSGNGFVKTTNQTIESNGWTDGGYHNADDVWQQLAVESVAINGKGRGAKELVFLSGTLYDASNNKPVAVYTGNYFKSADDGAGSTTRISNCDIQSIAVGNFDGNTAGREQVVFTIALKHANNNESHLLTGYMRGINYKDTTVNGEIKEYGTAGGYDCLVPTDSYVNTDAKNAVSFLVIPVDKNNDGVLAKYRGVTYAYTDPDVKAVLQAAPYFDEVMDAGNNETEYVLTESYELSDWDSDSVSFSIGYSTEFSFPGGKASIETGYALDWTKSFERSLHEEWSQSFSAQAYNSVVVSRTPVFVYEYDIQNADGTWNDKTVMQTAIPQGPVYEQLSVDAYNKFAEEYNKYMADRKDKPTCYLLEKIDPADNWMDGNEGDPYRYNHDGWESLRPDIQAAAISKSEFALGYNGTLDKVAWTKENTTTKSVEMSHGFFFNSSIKWGKEDVAMHGVTTSLEYSDGKGNSTSKGTAVGASCTVTSLDKQSLVAEGIPAPVVDAYRFHWTLGQWQRHLSGAANNKTPFIGYSVTNLSSPPRAIDNLDKTITRGEGFFDLKLSWTKPDCENGHPKITGYYVYSKDESGAYTKVSKKLSAEATEYEIKDLDLNGKYTCPAPYASEWKLELMAREVFRTVWKENAEDILGLLRMLDANLNTTGTPNDGNQLENKLSALNEELDDLVSQRASRSITMDDFLSKSTEINNEIINVEGLLQSSIQEQRPKARLDMHSIEAALSDDASFPDGKIEPGFLDRYTNRIVKSNNRYIWMLQLMNVQQIMPIQSERQPIAMVTYKSGVPYDIEQEQIGKQDKESAGPDCATICRPQDFFLNMSRTKRKRKLVEWLESCQENQVSVLDEKIPLLSFAVDFVTAYEYQKARGIKIHPGLWKDMRVDIFLVKKEN